MSGLGRLAVISGPSGSGKTTLCRRLLEDERVVLSVSATTRTQRRGEKDGVDYHFLPADEFQRRIDAGAFLEWAEYNGNRYGTLRSEVEEKCAAGQIVILEIEVQGTRKLREQAVDASYVFVMPPGLEELERRLRARKTEDDETIRKRMAIAREEMDMAHLYDHVVINRDLERATRELRIYLGLETGELELSGGDADD